MNFHENVEYEICGYEKEGEKLICEFSLKGANPLDLVKIFPEAEETELVACYPISKLQAHLLTEKFGITFDFSRYDYFLECFQSE